MKLFAGTYSAGRVFVREKAAQRYNTSSADEHAAAALFRREHPGLITRSTLSFNEIFSNKKSVINQTEEQSSSAQESLTVGKKNHFSVLFIEEKFIEQKFT